MQHASPIVVQVHVSGIDAKGAKCAYAPFHVTHTGRTTLSCSGVLLYPSTVAPNTPPIVIAPATVIYPFLRPDVRASLSSGSHPNTTSSSLLPETRITVWLQAPDAAPASATATPTPPLGAPHSNLTTRSHQAATTLPPPASLPSSPAAAGEGFTPATPSSAPLLQLPATFLTTFSSASIRSSAAHLLSRLNSGTPVPQWRYSWALADQQPAESASPDVWSTWVLLQPLLPPDLLHRLCLATHQPAAAASAAAAATSVQQGPQPPPAAVIPRLPAAAAAGGCVWGCLSASSGLPLPLGAPHPPSSSTSAHHSSEATQYVTHPVTPAPSSSGSPGVQQSCAVVVARGHPLKLQGCPFGCLAPHHFHGSTITGHILNTPLSSAPPSAAAAALQQQEQQQGVLDSSSGSQSSSSSSSGGAGPVLLLDAAVLPGMEGGPVTCGCCGALLALLAAPLHHAPSRVEVPLAVAAGPLLAAAAEGLQQCNSRLHLSLPAAAGTPGAAGATSSSSSSGSSSTMSKLIAVLEQQQQQQQQYPQDGKQAQVQQGTVLPSTPHVMPPWQSQQQQQQQQQEQEQQEVLHQQPQLPLPSPQQQQEQAGDCSTPASSSPQHELPPQQPQPQQQQGGAPSSATASSRPLPSWLQTMLRKQAASAAEAAPSTPAAAASAAAAGCALTATAAAAAASAADSCRSYMINLGSRFDPSVLEQAAAGVVMVRVPGSWASGVVVTHSGVIITNAHLFDPPEQGAVGSRTTSSSSSATTAAATSSSSACQAATRLSRVPMQQQQQQHQQAVGAGRGRAKVQVEVKLSSAGIAAAAALSAGSLPDGTTDIRALHNSSSSSSGELESHLSGWLPARLLYCFKGHLDLAVLQLQLPGSTTAGQTPYRQSNCIRLQPLRLAEAAPVRGAPVAVIGHGLFAPRAGFEPSTTWGSCARVVMLPAPGNSSSTTSSSRAATAGSTKTSSVHSAGSSSISSYRGSMLLDTEDGDGSATNSHHRAGISGSSSSSGSGSSSGATSMSRHRHQQQQHHNHYPPQQVPAMLITTASVHAGASGGALVCPVTGLLLGLVTSNARHVGGAVLPRLNFSIPAAELAPLWRWAGEYAQQQQPEQQQQQQQLGADQPSPLIGRQQRVPSPAGSLAALQLLDQTGNTTATRLWALQPFSAAAAACCRL